MGQQPGFIIRKLLIHEAFKMKAKFTLSVALFSTLMLSASVFAHDPSEMDDQDGTPDCSAMEKMDHAKMDMSDPVTQAMMKKCMKGMHHDAMEHEDLAVPEQGDKGDEKTGKADADGEHEH